jgi:hypothetical protein
MGPEQPDVERLDGSPDDPVWLARNHASLEAEWGIPRVAMVTTLAWYGVVALGRLTWSALRALLRASAQVWQSQPGADVPTRASTHTTAASPRDVEHAQR